MILRRLTRRSPTTLPLLLRPARLSRRLTHTSTSTCTPATYRLPPTISQLLRSPAQGEGEGGGGATEVVGWIKSIRKQKNVSFAVLTDGSSDVGLQAVILKKKYSDSRGGEEDEHEGLLRRLTNGAAVRVTGKLVASPGAGQAVELLVDAKEGGGIEVLGECDPDTYPIQKKQLTNEYLREHTHLRARTAHIGAMLRLRSTLARRIADFFEEQGFISANTPILTGNDAEGAGEAFRIAPMHNTVHPASSSSPSPSSPSPSSLSPTSPTSTHPQSQPQAPTSEEAAEFFARPAYLTVSHQLHLESLTTALSRVYTLSPCFRAEPSLTRRHLAEFWMLEAEWVSSPAAAASTTSNAGVGALCDFVEVMLRRVVGPLLSGPNADLDVQALWRGHLTSTSTSSSSSSSSTPASPSYSTNPKFSALQRAFAPPSPSSPSPSSWWKRMTYTEAITLLRTAHENHSGGGGSLFEYAPRWGAPLQAEHERYIAEVVVGGPVFVTDYPRVLKPFYMRVNDSVGGGESESESGSESGSGGRETVACFDLLIPHIGELVGGSVREEREARLRANMAAAGMLSHSTCSSSSSSSSSHVEGKVEGGAGETGGEEEAEAGWYLETRRWGGAPHGGFGMGFERLVSWVGGVENVRECVAVPRWAGRMVM